MLNGGTHFNPFYASMCRYIAAGRGHSRKNSRDMVNDFVNIKMIQ
jgi:hypothetical protein